MIRIRKSQILVPALALLGCVVSGSAVRAQTIFDFEELPVDTSGLLASITSTKDGITVTITRPPGTTFEIADISSFGPASFGARTLSPFANPLVDDYFVANFSTPVDGASIQFGDFGSDDDTTVLLEAFAGLNATGVSLDSDSASWGLKDFFTGDSPDTVSVAASSILSIRFKGGSVPGPQSLYWDNLTVRTGTTTVPEPGALALLIGGLGTAGLVLRRRQR